MPFFVSVSLTVLDISYKQNLQYFLTSISGLFHLALFFSGSSMLSHVNISLFLRLNYIPLYVHSTFLKNLALLFSMYSPKNMRYFRKA